MNIVENLTLVYTFPELENTPHEKLVGHVDKLFEKCCCSAHCPGLAG